MIAIWGIADKACIWRGVGDSNRPNLRQQYRTLFFAAEGLDQCVDRLAERQLSPSGKRRRVKLRVLAPFSSPSHSLPQSSILASPASEQHAVGIEEAGLTDFTYCRPA